MQCDRCGCCVSACTHRALTRVRGTVRHVPARCADCGACLEACPRHSSPRTQSLTVAQVVAQARRYRPFISGVTLSGGEPTLQPEFVAALCRALRRLQLPVLLETNGVIPPAVLNKLMPLIEGTIVDGKGSSAVAPVLRTLARQKKLHEVRLVILPAGQGDAAAAVRRVSRMLAAIDRTIPLRLVAFRREGVRGALRRGKTPSGATMRRLQAAALRSGLAAVPLA